MENLTQFLGVMAALSASATTMTTQMKRRFSWLQFTESQEGKTLQPGDLHLLEFKRGKAYANVHLVCGINGFILAALGNIQPLDYLALEPVWNRLPEMWSNWIDYVTAGVMVAYGGPWFHELLGLLREYKTNLRGRP